MSQERPALAELELELKRQDQLFKLACDTLGALGNEVRVAIPEHVLEELDAAFQVQAPQPGNLGGHYPLLRA